LLLGAGGAARAVACALERLGADRVLVSARREEQADRITEMAKRTTRLAWRDAGPRIAEFDLVVNATSVGMGGEALLEEPAFHEGQAVVDLVYDPPMTPLVEAARARGAAGWGGLGMLVHQAAASLRIWSGQEAPVEAMSMAAMHALSRH
jgi:shikimate dehydrogenase